MMSEHRRYFSPAVVLALFLAGCQASDPGLEEKLTRAQAELEAAKKELAAANERIEALKKEVEAARSAPAPAAPSAQPATAVNTASLKPLGREALEESYVSAARNLQRKIESALSSQYRIESFTLHPVEIAPQITTPYTSRLQIAFTRKADSVPIYVDLPVGADYSGEWKFPAPEEIAKTLAAGGTPPPQTLLPGSGPGAPPPPQKPQQAVVDPNIVNMAPGTPTVIFNWNDGPQAPAAAQQPPAYPGAAQPPPAQPPAGLPQFVMPGAAAPPAAQEPPPVSQPPPAQPQAPASEPAKVMPTDRDVIIQF